jgi:Zn-dependent peptidase ImmA (M78 family)
MYNTEITKRVNRLLHECNITAPPVPVENVSEKLGLRVVYDYFPEDISGILDLRDKNKPLIFINRGHHENRRRFSIAHEIGHFVLHKPLGVHVDKQSFFRSAKSAETLEDDEISANKFAAALLMPDYLIEKAIDLASDWLDTNDDVISVLAVQFQVSITAMSYRLQTWAICRAKGVRT